MIALAILALLGQQAPAVEKGSGFEFVLPKGWTRKAEEKATLLTPPGAKGDVRLILYPQHPRVVECRFLSLEYSL